MLFATVRTEDTERKKDIHKLSEFAQMGTTQFDFICEICANLRMLELPAFTSRRCGS
jgi:hypothetical protein